jgi:hypothetical protein
VIEETAVKKKWNHQHGQFEETTVGMVNLALQRMAAVSEGLGYVFLKVALEEVVVLEVTNNPIVG